MPSIDAFMKIEDDWLIAIALFVQHKLMDSEKLGRVMLQPKAEVSKVIKHLFYSGILVQKEKRFMHSINIWNHFLVQACLKKGII